jgi:hypothetical protein
MLLVQHGPWLISYGKKVLCHTNPLFLIDRSSQRRICDLNNCSKMAYYKDGFPHLNCPMHGNAQESMCTHLSPNTSSFPFIQLSSPNEFE